MGKYVSIKKYIIFIIFGAILEIIVFLVWLCTKNNIDGRLKILRDDISKAMVVIGIVLIALNIYLIINANKINKLSKNLEYNFCYKDELKDYHLFGKNTKEEKKYNKYSEWKDGIQNKYYEQINCEDFYRFLNKILRNKTDTKDMFEIVVIPLEFTVMTIYMDIYNECVDLISLIIVATVLLIILINNILNAREEVYFMQDFIEILFPHKAKSE